MDEANGLSVDSAGNVCVIGSTGSSDFPVTPGAYRTNYLDPGFFTWVGDAWVARLDLSLSTLIHASYFGGNYTESGLGVDFDPATLTATLVGSTGSTNLPLGPGPIQTTLGGAASGFLAQLELLPTGVRRIGASSPCRRALLLEPNRTATANDPQFRLLVSGAPATAAGFLLVSSAAASAPVTLPRPLGGTLLLDSSNSILAGLSSTASGTCDIPIPLTGIPPAAKGYVQTFWANDQTCLGSDLMSSSFALELTLK
jgi:hypothetical protein